MKKNNLKINYNLQSRYLIFNTLPKSIRVIITIMFLLLGFSIQLKSSILIGSIFILAASFLNIIRGINIKNPKTIDSQWERVTFSELYKIIDKIAEIKKWSSMLLPTKIAIIIVYGFIAFLPLLSLFSSNKTTFPLFINFHLLFIPLFLTGNRSIWIPSNIKLKIETLLECTKHPRLKDNPDTKIQPYLLVGKTKSQLNFPLDVKLMIELPKFSKDFLGIQIQASINSVGSKNYPYVYAVLISKRDLGLKMKDVLGKKIIHEYEKENEMDILVIRQYTTKTSGYHTDKNTINAIINEAIDTAYNLLKDTT